MSHHNPTSKIAGDLTLYQLIWAAFFLAAVVVFFFGMRIFSGGEPLFGIRIFSGEESIHTRPFLDFLLQPGSGFMFVLGVISVTGFLTFMVKQGVTRRTYFFGTAVSSFIVAAILTAAGVLIQLILQIFMTNIDWQPVLGYEDAPVTAGLMMLCQLYLFYLIGWMIGCTFYRFGFLAGLFSIAGSFLLLLGISYLISSDNSLPATVIGRLGLPELSGEVPLYVSLPILLLIAVILLAVMRMMTKRVRIRIK